MQSAGSWLCSAVPSGQDSIFYYCKILHPLHVDCKQEAKDWPDLHTMRQLAKCGNEWLATLAKP
jgi:hypothetical protein